MITTLFRIAVIPLALVLDHMMAPRRIREFYDYIDEYGDDLDLTGRREVS
ncbi:MULTISPECIES: hypothetical protein [unclassified Rhodococcus (in: high G+C Gram-positive bacteria)]|nr:MULTISPECIES: hypothetical protein [unclassified Rhodococcus (in: high G+C Gram-positive bacteria)]MBC2637703.1 hypothetical protein [Rhodococcus sp. 3A]MBC2897553.1 hypothetical protein [Rhodococcus sp. 4CII]